MVFKLSPALAILLPHRPTHGRAGRDKMKKEFHDLGFVSCTGTFLMVRWAPAWILQDVGLRVAERDPQVLIQRCKDDDTNFVENDRLLTGWTGFQGPIGEAFREYQREREAGLRNRVRALEREKSRAESQALAADIEAVRLRKELAEAERKLKEGSKRRRAD